MQVNSLSSDLAQFIDEAVASGQYTSVDAVVGAALQILRAQRPAQGAQASAMTPADGVLQSSDDYLQALAHALRTGEFGRARQLATEGAARYPAQTALAQSAHVLAPPTARAVPASAASRAAVQANHAWLHAHWQAYRGQWVAIRAGQLLAARASFDDLLAEVGDNADVLVTHID